MRGLFPIKDGDIFSREMIAVGLDNLRNACLQMGYVNFPSLPNTRFEDNRQLIYVDIDVDQGKQFYANSVDIAGLDEPTTSRLPPEGPRKRGQIYNQRLFRQFLLQDASRFSPLAARIDRCSMKKQVRSH